MPRILANSRHCSQKLRPLFVNHDYAFLYLSSAAVRVFQQTKGPFM